MFCNKIWNAVKFAHSSFPPEFKPLTVDELVLSVQKGQLRVYDHWILSKLNATVKSCNNEFENYLFAEICQH